MKALKAMRVPAALALLAITATTAPAHAQGNPFAGVWRCYGATMGAQVVYDIALQPNGTYSGTYVASNGYRSYSQGPYRLIGNILRFDFHVWQTYPRQTTNPGGDGYYFQFQGANAMYLYHYRCPQSPQCRLDCQRTA